LKKLLVIFLSVMFMSACGAGNSEQTQGQGSDTNGSGIVAGEMVPSLAEKNPLLFEYKVKNQTESDVTLEFTSSQRFDFSVENDKGEEIYLFSSLASFLQAMGEETVKPGEELVYEISLQDIGLEKGEYTLNTWMTPKDGAKYKVKTKFTVE
jgi:hypothetical protein